MKCIGFGSFEGKCDNEAGTVRTPYWCQRCDDLRVQHISKRFDQLVDESTEEVARKVLEWRLAMEGYRIFTKRASIDGDYDVANSHYDELKRLAGLEEQA